VARCQPVLAARTNSAAGECWLKKRQPISGGRTWREEIRNMLDVIFLAATAFFFALAIVYVRVCERLR
jgi:hypothetical protein